MTPLTLSIVVPVYSGAQYLEELAAAIDAERQRWEADAAPFRLIQAVFVADAPVDDSPEVLHGLAEQYSWLDVVTLARNFGQHPATIAGILHSSGDWVVTLDEDLQHRPEHIETLLRTAARSECDVVYALPQTSVHRGYRDFASRAYKRIVAMATGVPQVRSFNSFRLMRGPVARATASVCGHETYFDVALTWFTDRFEAIDLPLIDERFQTTGESGYRFRTLLSHARRMIVSSQAKPLRLGALVGLVAVFVASILAGVAFVARLVDSNSVEVRGWLSLFVAILFFGGITSMLLAVALEYLTNVVQHTQGKPTFFAVDRSNDAVLLSYFASKDAVTAPDG